MKLPELTRKRLRAGKSVELRLPVRPGKEGAIRRCPVQVDRAYPIENDEGTEMGEFTVLVVVREGDEWLALIHAGSDTLRYPARGGEYTTVPSLAMRRGDVPGPELPVVPEHCGREFVGGSDCCQRHMSELGRKRWDDYMHEQRPKEVETRRVRSLTNKMRRLQARAIKNGVDITPQLLASIEAIEERVAEQEAA